MPKIKIYSTPTCPYCKQEKEYLKEKGVDFEDINVAADAERAKEMVEKTGQMGVPVAIITDDSGKEEIVLGFDQDKLNKLLNL